MLQECKNRAAIKKLGFNDVSVYYWFECHYITIVGCRWKDHCPFDHSAYVKLYFRCENAMREKVANVTIPYWDNTIDEGLQNPRQSILFSPLFMGTANGQVTQGRF